MCYEAETKDLPLKLKDKGAVAPTLVYALCPGYITTKSGDIVYISARNLASLYGVIYRNCVIIDFTDEMTYLGRDLKKYILLNPKSNGNYKLPKK